MSLGFLGGLTFLASQVDGEFDEFMSEALLKDSSDYAGYEPELKADKVRFASIPLCHSPV